MFLSTLFGSNCVNTTVVFRFSLSSCSIIICRCRCCADVLAVIYCADFRVLGGQTAKTRWTDRPREISIFKKLCLFSISNSSAGLLGPDNNPLIITIQVLHLHRSAAIRHTIITCSVVSTRGAASVNNIITKVKASRWWCETLSPDDVVTVVTIERQILRKVRVFLLSQPADQKV